MTKVMTLAIGLFYQELLLIQVLALFHILKFRFWRDDVYTPSPLPWRAIHISKGLSERDLVN